MTGHSDCTLLRIDAVQMVDRVLNVLENHSEDFLQLKSGNVVADLQLSEIKFQFVVDALQILKQVFFFYFNKILPLL